MIYAAEVVAAWIVYSLFDAQWSDASIVLDLVAVAAIVGSVAAYNRLKTALAASEAAASAWHEERDASVARAERVEQELKDKASENVALVAKIAALELRPDLTKLESLVDSSNQSMLRHETQAAERTDRLISAIEMLPAAIVPYLNVTATEEERA